MQLWRGEGLVRIWEAKGRVQVPVCSCRLCVPRSALSTRCLVDQGHYRHPVQQQHWMHLVGTWARMKSAGLACSPRHRPWPASGDEGRVRLSERQAVAVGSADATTGWDVL